MTATKTKLARDVAIAGAVRILPRTILARVASVAAVGAATAVIATSGGGGQPQFGVDWAWGTPSISALHARGVKFAAGYLSYDASKNLSRGEVQRLHAAGIKTVLVWETTANRAQAGYAAGRSDALEARRQATAAGEPSDRPIFFAVDFDSTGIQNSIIPYFRGVVSVLGSHRTGGYGGFATVQALFSRGLIGYAWQTYAWSFGRWDARAKLQQYSNDHAIDGVGVDYDRSTAADYGQFPLPKVELAKPKAKVTPPVIQHHVARHTARWVALHYLVKRHCEHRTHKYVRVCHVWRHELAKA